MAISRRQFLKRTGLTAAGSILAPGFFHNPLLSRALADVIGDRYFVSLFLDGGNDGLGTVMPAENGGLLRGYYEQVRNFAGAGAIGIDIADLEKPAGFTDPNTGEQLGLRAERQPRARGHRRKDDEHALEGGEDARAVSYIQIADSQDRKFFGVGIDHNIVGASLKALLSAMNRSMRTDISTSHTVRSARSINKKNAQ